MSNKTHDADRLGVLIISAGILHHLMNEQAPPAPTCDLTPRTDDEVEALVDAHYAGYLTSLREHSYSAFGVDQSDLMPVRLCPTVDCTEPTHYTILRMKAILKIPNLIRREMETFQARRALPNG